MLKSQILHHIQGALPPKWEIYRWVFWEQECVGSYCCWVIAHESGGRVVQSRYLQCCDDVYPSVLAQHILYASITISSRSCCWYNYFKKTDRKPWNFPWCEHQELKIFNSYVEVIVLFKIPRQDNKLIVHCESQADLSEYKASRIILACLHNLYPSTEQQAQKKPMLFKSEEYCWYAHNCTTMACTCNCLAISAQPHLNISELASL